MDQFKEVKSVNGNIQAFLQEKNNCLEWECARCGRLLDGDDPEGELCKDCFKKKQEKQNDRRKEE